MAYETDYSALQERLTGLIRGVPHTTASLANAAALLYESLEAINWAGFYLAEGEPFVLGPFQGKPACIEIPFGRGVCGTAAREDRTQRVEDVHCFPGHIACDAASASEIVIPLHASGKVIGVLDIDSPERARFSAVDQVGLEGFARILEQELFN